MFVVKQARCIIALNLSIFSFTFFIFFLQLFITFMLYFTFCIFYFLFWIKVIYYYNFIEVLIIALLLLHVVNHALCADGLIPTFMNNNKLRLAE